MKFWTLVTLIIFVPIYILALILVKEGIEGSLEPFILLNIGALSIPVFLKMLFSKHDDEQSKKKKKSCFGKFMLIGTILTLVLSIGLWMMNLKYSGLTSTDIIGIGVGLFLVFPIIYFFMWFLPEKMGLEE